MVELNKVYCIDNLELLKQLPDNYIDLIYCDILYGTGRNFGDYQDLKCDREVIEEHYIPRIKEMYRVLKDTGLIYLQMDTRINHWIRCLMDDIFGYENFKNEIVWSYNSAPRKKNCFGHRHDIILRYSKSDNFTFNKIREPYSETAPRGYEKEKYYNSEGKVIGDVTIDGNLTVGEAAQIIGEVKAKNVTLSGKLDGIINCSDKLILESKAVLKGDLNAKVLVIQEGALFEGKSNMITPSVE